MQRRVFFVAMCAALAAPLATEAQPARVYRIGILTTGSPHSAPAANWAGFAQGLRESRYVEGAVSVFAEIWIRFEAETCPSISANAERGNRMCGGSSAHRVASSVCG